MRMKRSVALLATLLLLSTLAPPLAAAASQNMTLQEPVEVTALAVAMTEEGERVGSSASISVTVARNGSGHVFIDTRPLAGTDMQGSARIAARVASAVTGYSMGEHDFFFVVRSPSPIIAGPSAGGIMTSAAVVALKNAHLEPGEEPWELDPGVMATGTIGPDGSIGPVGGILEKAEAAAHRGAKLFLVPEGQGNHTPRQMQDGVLVQGDPVEVSTYCREELQITCREVSNVETLVAYSTGHRFERPSLGSEPSTAQYNETMAPLSRDLIDQASSYHATWDRLNDTDLSPEAHEQVLGALQRAQAMDAQARALWEQSDYYSAASRAFSASIHGTHAAIMLDFFEGGRSLDFIADRIEHATGEVREAEEAAGQAEVTGMNTLYTVGAAQERVSDAEARIGSAWTNFNESNLGAAMFDVAWALERSKTVHWWLSLSEPFGDGPPLPVSTDQLADEFLSLAREMLAYSGSVLRTPNGPERAAEQLERARNDDRRGFHAAALLEAAQAQVRAALAVEVQGGTLTSDKINSSREEAGLAIQQARARGVEPMLAVAMFEFAGAQEEPVIALEFHRTARVYAGFSSVLTGASDPTPSRFVGNFEGGHVSTAVALPPDVFRTLAVGWLTIGVFGTLSVVIAGTALVRRDD